MQGNLPPGAARPAVAATLLVLVLAVQPGWIRSANAARPPEGRTYFTTLIGLAEPFAGTATMRVGDQISSFGLTGQSVKKKECARLLRRWDVDTTSGGG